MNLTLKEKESILAEFPKNIKKLSYENIVHKKVSNASLITAIPQGKKCFAWFTQKEEKPICYLMELQGRDKQISDIRVINTCFDSGLSYGTIFYGTIFHYEKQAFYSMEDIFYYQGNSVMHDPWNQKINIFKKIMQKQIKQVAYHPNFIIFGLPLMDTNFESFVEKIKELPYKIYGIQFRKDQNHSLSQMPFQYLHSCLEEELTIIPNNVPQQIQVSVNKPLVSVNKPLVSVNKDSNKVVIPSNKHSNSNFSQVNRQSLNNLPVKRFKKKDVIFKVRPDIQNDIYHLYCLNEKGVEEFYEVAYIPDYKTSLFMNRLFRNIKENNNLDALEESDDEEDFENDREDRHVFLDREYLMLCSYHSKFKKWVPLRIVPNGSLVELKELS
jgi:hypothetical protein